MITTVDHCLSRQPQCPTVLSHLLYLINQPLHLIFPSSQTPPPPSSILKMSTFKPLNVAIIGAGLGGLSIALSLRRAGHNITIYERSSFAGEIGAGLSTASNGSKWLLAWGVGVEKAKPVIVKRLIMRKWGSGEVVQEAPMGAYGEKFGFVRTISSLFTLVFNDIV